MPICQHCGKEWAWLDTMKKVSKFHTRMICHHCGESQYQSQSSRNKMSLIALLPIILFPATVIFNLPGAYMLLLGLILSNVVILLTPFMLKLSNEEEPLW